MVRTQLSFDRQTLKRAQTRARRLGISLAEYVRRLVKEDLGERRSSRDASAVFDLGSSGGADVAELKDEMIAEAFQRKTR